MHHHIDGTRCHPGLGCAVLAQGTWRPWMGPMQRYLFAVEYTRAAAPRLSALSDAYARTKADEANCLEPGAIVSIIT